MLESDVGSRMGVETEQACTYPSVRNLPGVQSQTFAMPTLVWQPLKCIHGRLQWSGKGLQIASRS